METLLIMEYNELITAINEKNKHEVIHAKFCAIVKTMDNFCSTEESLFKVYRILKRIEADLQFDLQKPDIKLCEFVNKLLFLIKAEEDILVYQFNNPGLIDRFTARTEVPRLLQWTDDKVSLIELIYAISPSIDNGKASIKAICDCFAFMFQTDLRGSYRALCDINIRKKDVTRYLDTLPGNLLHQLDKINK